MMQVPQPGVPNWDSKVTVLLRDLVREVERLGQGPLVVRLRGPGDVVQVYVGTQEVAKLTWDGTNLAFA